MHASGQSSGQAVRRCSIDGFYAVCDARFFVATRHEFDVVSLVYVLGGFTSDRLHRRARLRARSGTSHRQGARPHLQLLAGPGGSTASRPARDPARPSRLSRRGCVDPRDQSPVADHGRDHGRDRGQPARVCSRSRTTTASCSCRAALACSSRWCRSTCCAARIEPAQYILTGSWGKQAADEAMREGTVSSGLGRLGRRLSGACRRTTS